MTLLAKYNSIDAMKMFMAFCVVGIHVNHFTNDHLTDWVVRLFFTAVPFFFVASGFLLENKILRAQANGELTILKSSAKKNLRIYLLWILLYFPIALYDALTNSLVWYMDIARYLRGVILIGETKLSWPLWFLLALVVAVCIIYWLRKRSVSHEKIFLIGICLMLAGHFISVLKDARVPVISTLCKTEMLVYGTRNGIFTGLALVSSGILIRKHLEKIAGGLHWGVPLLCVGLGLILLEWPFGSFFLGVALFLITLSLRLPDHGIFKRLRTDSMLVYLMHMFVIVLLYFVLSEICSIDMKSNSVYLMLPIVFFLTWGIAVGIDFLRKKPGFHWLAYFIE